MQVVDGGDVGRLLTLGETCPDIPDLVGVELPAASHRRLGVLVRSLRLLLLDGLLLRTVTPPVVSTFDFFVFAFFDFVDFDMTCSL